MVDITSSFGLTSLTPYLSNLPPIRFCHDDRPPEQKMSSLENHFSQLNISATVAMAATSTTGQRLANEDSFREQKFAYLQVHPLTNPLSTSSISPYENPNRRNLSSDEEKSGQVAINKPQPLQLQQQQQSRPPPLQQKPSPLDSSSLEPATRPVYYPDRVSTNTTGIKINRVGFINQSRSECRTRATSM